MTSKSIHVRLPPKVFEDAQAIVDEGLFSSLNELVKESVRTSVMEYRRRRALSVLAKHYGSAKPGQLSDEEKEEVLEEFLRGTRRGIH